MPPPDTSPSPLLFPPWSLLLVEDDEGLADLFQHALRDTQIPMHWARTGKDAMEWLASAPKCLILLDYSLPDMTATELVENLSRTGFVPPFIVITGHGGEQVAVSMMKLGAKDYLVKDTQLLDRLPQVVDRVLRDIQVRLELETSEQRRLANEKELSIIFENNPTAMVLLDSELRLRKANPAALKLMFKPFDVLRKSRPGDFLSCRSHSEDPRGCGFGSACPDCPFRCSAIDTLKTGQACRQVEAEIFRVLSGKLVSSHFLVSTVRLEMGDSPCVLVCLEDVTVSKRAERALRESEEQFRRAVLEAPIPIMIHDEEDRVVQISRGWTHYSGYTHQDIPTVGDWTQRAFGARKDSAKEYINNLFSINETTHNGEWEVTAKNGSRRVWELQTTPLGAASNGKRFLLSMAVDITDRKQAEANLLRSQRMESVGRLASGIAHDLNNVLAPILMVLPLLREEIADEEVRQFVDTIESSAKRGASIIKQVLTFGRGIESKTGPIQLRHLIKEMAQIIHETFPKCVTLETRCPLDLWVLIGDATQLHQVLMNLCLNARDAMAEGGTITMKAENLYLENGMNGTVGRIQPGPCVLLTIADTGTGIAAADLDRIFDPFFTTKELGKGTGLGLSTVTGVVKVHGGIINVESAIGHGSTFKIYLPAAPDAQPVSLDLKDLSALPQGKGETILIVDDESSIREITSQTLAKNGYRVLCAANGAEALETFSSSPAPINLVLADYMMPRMDGLALSLSLRAMAPGLKIVLSTGIGESMADSSRLQMKAAGVGRILAKPYSARILLSTIREELSPLE